MPYVLNTCASKGIGLRGTNFKLNLPVGGFSKISEEEKKDLLTNKGVRNKLERKMFIFRDDQPVGRVPLHVGRSGEKEIPEHLKPSKKKGSKGGTVEQEGLSVTGGESAGVEEVKIQEAKPIVAQKAKDKK